MTVMAAVFGKFWQRPPRLYIPFCPSLRRLAVHRDEPLRFGILEQILISYPDNAASQDGQIFGHVGSARPSPVSMTEQLRGEPHKGSLGRWSHVGQEDENSRTSHQSLIGSLCRCAIHSAFSSFLLHLPRPTTATMRLNAVLLLPLPATPCVSAHEFVHKVWIGTV
jgi:hypothetical protein